MLTHYDGMNDSEFLHLRPTVCMYDEKQLLLPSVGVWVALWWMFCLCHLVLRPHLHLQQENTTPSAKEMSLDDTMSSRGEA